MKKVLHAAFISSSFEETEHLSLKSDIILLMSCFTMILIYYLFSFSFLISSNTFPLYEKYLAP